jgi:hypothetical protein
MRRTRVILATLACVAFLAVSAGTASADGGHYKCQIYVQGIPCQDGKVCISIPYKGIECLGNGGSFWANPHYPIQLRAKVGKYFGPWKYGYVKWVSGKCILDVGRLFCTFKVTGIPAGCKIKLCDGRLLGNTTLCLPLYTYLGYQGVSGDVRGPWHAATVKCDDLNVAKKFCIFTVAGIPKERCGGVVDIKGIVSGLGNDKSFCAPNGAVIYCRARLPGNPPPPTGADISGPYHPVKVWCEKEELNVSKKFVKVTFKAGWKTCKDLITVIRDLNKGIGENTFWCFPKGANVYTRPGMGESLCIWFRKVFYEDTCVIWKVVCVTTKPKPDPE